MIKVYGYSDDNVDVDGAPYPADEIDCYDSKVQIRFSDGTLIEIEYGKNGLAIWKITILEKGMAKQILTECNDENADIYSDIFEIDADYVWHKRIYK